ncbi:glycosyltransferase family 2 protein [bacterium]|nr:glycosyltransferase family 2 protein [bacterium]
MKSKKPLISIIVLTYNGLAYTRLFLKSFMAKTTYSSHELIIVDNGSNDGTVDYLNMLKMTRVIPGLKVILNDKNLGYAAGNNVGIKQARDEYILIVNNDVILVPGWIEGLYEGFLKAGDDCGIIGPVTNRVKGMQRIQDPPYKGLDEMEKYALSLKDKIGSGSLKEVERVIGFCMLVKKEVFDSIGLFDPEFKEGNFEDDDLCFRVRKKGYRIYYSEGIFIHHFGGKTFEANQIDNSRLHKQNKWIFIRKWGVINYLKLRIKNSKTLRRYLQRFVK